MTKQRILVMNGRRLVENQSENKWSVNKVEPAGTLKPGIYNIYNSKPADKSKSDGYTGEIIHSDKEAVYQIVGKDKFIKHEAKAFQKPPSVGENVKIEYQNNKAVVNVAKTQSRSRGR